tara:strand:+ start:1600 stop:1908 length:309 start_codon:yes stop_codon:yes gene_type:complete
MASGRTTYAFKNSPARDNILTQSEWYGKVCQLVRKIRGVHSVKLEGNRLEASYDRLGVRVEVKVPWIGFPPLISIEGEDRPREVFKRAIQGKSGYELGELTA